MRLVLYFKTRKVAKAVIPQWKTRKDGVVQRYYVRFFHDPTNYDKPDLGSSSRATFVEATTLKEAVAFAKSLVVGEITVSDRRGLEVLNLVNAQLAEAKRLGALHLPTALEINRDAFPFSLKNVPAGKESPAAYVPSTKTLFVNPKAMYWQAGGAFQEEIVAHERGKTPPFWSTAHRFYVIFHELGHVAHHATAGGRYDLYHEKPLELEMAEVVREQVSDYAHRNYKEFVAEVFAARLAGKVFSSQIIRWYNKVRSGVL